MGNKSANKNKIRKIIKGISKGINTHHQLHVIIPMNLKTMSNIVREIKTSVIISSNKNLLINCGAFTYVCF